MQPALDMIPIEVESLLRLMTEMQTTLPTLAGVVGACLEAGVPDSDALGRLEGAIAAGLVDVFEDLGPETLVALSTLGAEKMGVRPTFDSRRWVDRRTGRLVGPHDASGRYRPRKPDLSEGDFVPLHMRVDVRQLSPDQLLEEAERAKEARKAQYSGDRPELAPTITRFYGLNAICTNSLGTSSPATCEHHPGEKIGIHGYCLDCHASGMDLLMEKPKVVRIRNMPKGKSKLKGGV